MAKRVRAMVRKIWDDRQRPATGALGRMYLGRLSDVPRVGRRLTLFVDRRDESGPPFLVTAPIERILGDKDRGLLFVDTGNSIYRVSLGAPHIAALGRLGRRSSDRRAFARISMQTSIRVSAAGKSHIGLTENVSAGGILFQSAAEFAVGATVDLRLKLHGSLAVETHASGVVVRSAPDDRDWTLPRLTAVEFDEPWQVA